MNRNCNLNFLIVFFTIDSLPKLKEKIKFNSKLDK